MANKQVINFNTQQIDESDCGVACLSSIIVYYNGFIGIEELRELSGTNKFGTTMLGLYQASEKSGFTAKGLRASTDYLMELQRPCILHMLIDGCVNHYMVFYCYDKGEFIFGDPAIGIVKYTEPELEKIWVSKSILDLTPNDTFIKVLDAGKQKRKWFLHFLKEDASLLISITILSLLVTLTSLGLLIFIQHLLDKIIPDGSESKLANALAGVGLLVLLRSWLNYIRGKLLNLQSQKFNNRIIDFFFNNLLYLPKTFFANRKIGELVARMDDTARIQTVIAYISGDFIKEILSILIAFTILLFYSAKIFFIILLSLPIFIILSLMYHKRIVKNQRELMMANAQKTSNYINTIQSIDTIKSNNRQLHFSDINKFLYGVFQEKIFTINKMAVSLQLTTDIISAGFILIALWYSAFMVMSGTLKVGEFTAVFSLATSILPMASNLSFINTRLQGAKIAFNRMYEFASVKPEEGINPHTDQIEIEKEQPGCYEQIVLTDVSFGYAGRKLLLNNINLEISKGKITCLVGESGSGKTSLLNILGRFYQINSGIILIDNTPIDKIHLHNWRNNIGLMQQEIDILNGNIYYNICLTASVEEYANVEIFCTQYGFDQYLNQLPKGLYTILGEEGISISGGQKQLLGLARVLYKSPKILLLDEPTASMDKKMESFVINLLRQVSVEMGIMLITHKSNLLALANTIYKLENGTTMSSVKMMITI